MHNIPASGVKQRLLKMVTISHSSRVGSCRNNTDDKVLVAVNARSKYVVLTTMRHSQRYQLHAPDQSCDAHRHTLHPQPITLACMHIYMHHIDARSSPTHNQSSTAVVTALLNYSNSMQPHPQHGQCSHQLYVTVLASNHELEMELPPSLY